MQDGAGPAQAEQINVPSAAPELVERLTAALGVTFTFTDDVGAVLASTAGHPRGQIDPIALIALRQGEPIEQAADGITSAELRDELDTPATTPAGLLAPEPGVYLPVRINGKIDGVLIAHGQPTKVGTVGRTAAAVIGVALEFARGASISARQSPGPDLALHQVLRGSLREARRGAMVMKVIGWDLSVPRVGLVVLASHRETTDTELLDPSLYTMIADYVKMCAPGTPMGQLHPTEWVLLPELESTTRRPSPQQLAEDVSEALTHSGARVLIGLGEPHAGRSVPSLRRSYSEALYAARCGAQLRKHRPIYRLRDLGAAAFLAPSHRTRRRLAQRIVQPLREQPDVLNSVQAFLEASCSFTATANETGLHRHTVRSHLDRARELTGLDPRQLDDALQLRIALMLAQPNGKSPD
jgi:sugar diacid utilization regulator